MSHTINCNGKLLSLEAPIVMGILNATPDSFFDGGKFNHLSNALSQIEKMINDGVSIIDIGGYSTRPNAPEVSEKEEIDRILPIVKEAVKQFPNTLFSIDTFRVNVAEECLKTGAHIINDVSGGIADVKMFETVAKYNVPYILMHSKGTPKTMQHLTNYEDIVKEMMYYFSQQISKARQTGIKDIIIDPGFGFAKTLDQNYEILSKLEVFQLLEVPLLSALSRKSMIYKLLDNNPEDALNGTTALHTISLLKGAKILRVHDVKEAVECVKIYKKMFNSYLLKK
ncbi:dihydropteroate synthase [Capnocytophaga sp. ARDL2]|uniref:dihydropteroate synthase n=1 Tax=Capnocytophaga sp. ARDL2 TaxID=3238809 RepID=UPI0035566231